jgi:hypothetical protein
MACLAMYGWHALAPDIWIYHGLLLLWLLFLVFAGMAAIRKTDREWGARRSPQHRG